MVLRRWATRKLRSGDLTALAAMAGGGPKPRNGSYERLTGRGFVAASPNGEASIIVRGRLALAIRRAMAS
jgi:hypothetical protein